MEQNHYLLVLNSLTVGGVKWEPRKIVEALFAEQVWLFPRTPSMEALQPNDRFLILGSVSGRLCLLGHYKLKTSPGKISASLLKQLRNRYPLAGAITEAALWENPIPSDDIMPGALISEEEKTTAFYMGQGLRQVSKKYFESLVTAIEEGLESTGNHLSSFGPADDIPIEIADKDDLDALRAVEWFWRLVNVEIPQREAGLAQAMEQLTRALRLEARLEELKMLVQIQRQTIEVLEEENYTLRQQTLWHER